MKKAALVLILILVTGKLFAQNDIGVIQSGQDTLKHKMVKYGSIAQLLKGMEGFEIGDDGTVFHNGQQINIAKINGKEYLGANIAKAIKMFPASMVQNIDVVTDEHIVRKGVAPSGTPQEILSIIVNENPTYFSPNFSGNPRYRMRGRRFIDDDYYVTGLGFPTETDPRNPSDRNVDRAIRNMQLSASTIGEVNEYGDMIPHFVIKEWPGPGKLKIKSDKKTADTTSDAKQVQP